jgi:hypothetical protein
MRIHYEGPDAVVTSAHFIRRGSPPEVFALRELRDIGVVDGRRATPWRRPRRHELRADYRGISVTLFASADPRVFNQVRRALLRAVENLPWPDRQAA